MIANEPILQRLRGSLEIARVGEDPEGVHEVRVTTRRLRVWLTLGGWRVLQDDLRWLCGTAGAVRDLDVMLGRDPPEPWRAWLGRRRKVARRRLLAAFGEPRLAGLLEALAHMPMLSPGTAAAHMPMVAARLLEVAARMEENPGDILAMHRVRRALRRLRYALEWLAQPAEPLKALQDAFGAAGDEALALGLLEDYPGGGRLVEYRAHLRADMEQHRAQAFLAWQQARPFIESKA